MDKNQQKALDKAINSLDWSLIMASHREPSGTLVGKTAKDVKRELKNIAIYAYDNELRQMVADPWMIQFNKDFTRVDIIFCPSKSAAHLDNDEGIDDGDGDELFALRELLVRSEGEEDYELCAKLRNRIRKLEGKRR